MATWCKWCGWKVNPNKGGSIRQRLCKNCRDHITSRPHCRVCKKKFRTVEALRMHITAKQQEEERSCGNLHSKFEHEGAS